MQVLHDRFDDDPSVSVLAVHFDDRGDPAAYLAEHDYTFRTIPSGHDIAQRFGVTSIPTFIVIDRDGRVVHSYTGTMTDDIRAEIERAVLAARDA